MGTPAKPAVGPVEKELRDLLARRIVVIDGAMGTMIQREGLAEADYRGERFRDHPKDLKGMNDLLCITKPEVIEKIHRQYLDAGADIIETNTFGATTVALADYELQPFAYEINVAAAKAARRAADAVMKEQPGRRCFVAGAIGPMNRSLSMSRDVNDPGARLVVFDEVEGA